MVGSLADAAAEFGRLATEAGHPDSRVMYSYPFGLADDADAEQRFKERVFFCLQSITPAFPDGLTTAPPHIAYCVDIVRRPRSISAGDLGERSVVTGDAERCMAHLKQVEQAGIEEVILYFNVGLYPHVETMGMIERFARGVPAFAGT